MRRITVTLALAFAAALGACAADDPATLMASARQYLAKRDFNASIIQLKNVLQKAPENGEARYLLGFALLELGDADGAKIELEKAVQLGFSTDEVQVALARTSLLRGELDRLVREFGSKKLSGEKSQAELRSIVGMARLARGEREQAQRAFDEVLAADPAHVTANLGAARLAAAKQDFATAAARVERALTAAPSRLEALALKADLLAVQGQDAAAEQAYRSAIEAAPHQAARLALITHLLRHGALDKAASEAAVLEQAAPKDPRSFYAKALVRLEQGNFAQAKEAILHVLKVAPEHVPSLTLAGMAALQTGALAEAESHLRKALFNAPQALAAKRLLATTHLRMGKTEAALVEVTELMKLTHDPAVVALAGEAHLASGDLTGAVRHYEHARSLAPKNAAVQTRLALIRLAAGETERAVSDLEEASAADSQAYQADLALIANYLRRRDAERALQALKTLEKKQPQNPLTPHLRGVALALNKDFSGARASFARALELQPAYMPAIGGLVQLDMQEGKPAAARQRYEAVLKKEPNNEQALIALAHVLRMSGASREEIEKPLKQSVAASPASPRARLALVNFYLGGRDYKAALAAAQEANAAVPNQPAVIQALGTTQLAAGQARQATATFIRLAELAPKSTEPLVLLARVQMAAGQPDEAIRALRAALELRPELAALQRDIAAIYVATGRHEQALREARALQAEKPKEGLGHMLEAEIYVAQQKLGLAERTYRAALKKFDLPGLMVRMHSVLEAAGKRSEANATAEEWIKRHPKDASVLAYLAERDIAAKRYESAAARYEGALKRLPDQPLFLNNLAWVSHELKRPQALDYAERAHELAPQQPAIMDTLGTILVAAGQAERGLELLGRAAQLAPDAHAIRLNFARALLQADRQPAARRELEELAKLDARLPVQQEAATLLEGLSQ